MVNHLVGERLVSLLPDEVLLCCTSMRPVKAFGRQREEVLGKEGQLRVLDVFPQHRQEPGRSKFSVLILRSRDVEWHRLEDQPWTGGGYGSADDTIDSALKIEAMAASERGKGDKERRECGRLRRAHHLDHQCRIPSPPIKNIFHCSMILIQMEVCSIWSILVFFRLELLSCPG